LGIEQLRIKRNGLVEVVDIQCELHPGHGYTFLRM
jgi:hypothetical protein